MTEFDQHQDETGHNSLIASAMLVYEVHRKRLVRSLTDYFVDEESAADGLLGSVDEFGVDETIKRLTENPGQFGSSFVAPVTVTVAALLEDVVAAHDEIDTLQAVQNTLARVSAPNQLPTVFIQGRAYVMDAERGCAWEPMEPSRVYPMNFVERDDASLESRRLAARQRDLTVKDLKRRGPNHER
jgi:hypothetical protein